LQTATVCRHPVTDYVGDLRGLYSAYRLRPGWLGTPLHAGTSVTRGIPIGIGVIVISFVLTGIYVWRANGEFDRLTKSVLNEVKAS
jgi:uncharacterized membrane protein (DUF485 family)